MEVLQKVKNTLQSNNCTRHLPQKYKNTNSKGYMHPDVDCTLFITARLWKQPKYPLIDEWIKKMGYVYAMDYYSTIKK